MSQRLNFQELRQVAFVTHAPARTKVDRTFGLPTGLYVATVAAYLGFLGVMALAFMNPGLAIPMVIFAGFIIAGFGVPALWTRMNPVNDSRALSWGQFLHRGIETHTGRLTSKEATVQVLILPVLIFVWGVAVAVIAALT